MQNEQEFTQDCYVILDELNIHDYEGETFDESTFSISLEDL